MIIPSSIEWLDLECVIRPEWRHLIDEVMERHRVPEPDRALIVPAANLKDPAKVEADIDKKFAAAVAGHEAAVAKAMKEARRAITKITVNPLYSKTIAIAHGQDDAEIDVVYGDDEAAVLRGYVSALQERNPLQRWDGSSRGERAPVVGGHNVKFDVRFLWKRCVMLGLAMPYWWPLDVAKDYDKRIIDTGNLWTLAEFASLDDVCLETGGVGKEDVDGSMVDALHQAGDWDTIVRYAKGDLQTRTRPAYHRMIAGVGLGPLAGKVTAATPAIAAPAMVLDDELPEWATAGGV